MNKQGKIGLGDMIQALSKRSSSAGRAAYAVFSLVLLGAFVAGAQEVMVKRGGPQGTVLVPLDQATPTSPNPMLSFLPVGVEPDWAYWNAKAWDEGQKRRAARSTPARVIAIGESEPNDTPGTATPVPGFGTGAGDDGAANVSGSYPTPSLPGPLSTSEDNGSIPLATATGLSSGSAVFVATTLGDGPYGGSSGDFDFFSISGVTAGQTITIDVDTFDSGITFDSFVFVWDSAGAPLAFNDDESLFGGIFDSLLAFVAPSAGTYYVSIGAYLSEAPLDPFDSSSGLGFSSTGLYDVTIGLEYGDPDFFSIDLEAGDIIGVTALSAATSVALFDPLGALRISSSQDFSYIYPPSSPLPGGGNATLAYVVETTGTFAIQLFGGGAGGYTAEFRVFRPETESGSAQTLFLDFDGALIDTSIWGGPGLVALSPLSFFLSAWGLTGGDLNATIDSIIAAVTENISEDSAAFGLNPNFGVEILNSRDHADPFGASNVSRVIVGGSIAESGILTIGIAESIDVGNFDQSESALVLLDFLSAPGGNLNSLNQYLIDPSATIVDLIGVGVGNITAHEIGHYLGNFHTDQFNPSANIMDQGGNLANTVGVGIDNTFGNGDDVDVDFDVDVFVFNEGFAGIEDTLNTTAFALSATEWWVDFAFSGGESGFINTPFNTLAEALAAVPASGTVKIKGNTGDPVSNETMTINQAVTIKAVNGTVRIGG